MATDFNINDFIGGGSASNFGNFGDTSTPADLFSPSSAPSQPFAFDAFEGASFNSPQVDASLFGFQGTPSSTVSNPIPEFSGSFLGQSASPFSPPSFADLERRLQSAQPVSFPSSSFLGQPQSFQQNATELLRNVQDANTGLNSFLNNLTQPIVSSTPDPGLEAFNRYNPTTRQFEQLFGNQKAIEQFDDSKEFLESIRDEAQRNATNFLGQPVTNEQLAQAEELGALIGTGGQFIAASEPSGLGEPLNPQILKEANYGKAPENISTDDLNKLLNMRKSQQAQADNQRRVEFMKTDENFVKGMAEMNQAQAESRAAFDRASALRQQELENRIPFNATFNYDDQGNKVLAGASARAAGQGPDITQAEARAIAKGKSYRASAADKAEGIRAEMAVNKRLQEKQLTQQAEAVQGFLSQYTDPTTGKAFGSELGIDGIREGIKAVGSAREFVRMYGDLQSDLSAIQKNGLDQSIAGIARFGEKLKDSTLFKKKGSNETLMMGQSMETGQWGNVDDRGIFTPQDITKWTPTSYSSIEGARNKASELQTGIFEESNAIKVLERFRASREVSEEGFASFVTDLKGKIQNFVGQDLDPQAMRNAVARAGFQALLGRIRIDVLGPGVLTEIDAQRLIEAMGGYGTTSDRETTLFLIDQLIEDKKRSIDGKLTVYDQYRTSFDTLEDELPFMSLDNIERVRRGDFGRNIGINDEVDLTKLFQ